MEEKKSLLVWIPGTLHRELKLRAVASGETLATLVIRALRAYLETKE